VTFPLIFRHQLARELLCRGRRISAEEAVARRLFDRMAETGSARGSALALATEIAQSGLLAIGAIRRIMRCRLADQVQRILSTKTKGATTAAQRQTS
jgi:enoyl-CoA hydratase/carnithine racemase